MRVVRDAAHRVAVVADNSPRLAAVLGSPKLTGIGFLAVPRDAVTSLDEGIDPRRIRRRDCHFDLPDVARRQTPPPQPRPRGPAIVRDEKPAAWSAAFNGPRTLLDLPHA